jgi:hypothetical protein
MVKGNTAIHLLRIPMTMVRGLRIRDPLEKGGGRGKQSLALARSRDLLFVNWQGLSQECSRQCRLSRRTWLLQFATRPRRPHKGILFEPSRKSAIQCSERGWRFSCNTV